MLDVREIQLSALDDTEIDALFSIVSDEQHKRIDAAVRAGKYPAPTVTEKQRWTSGDHIDTIRSYITRCKGQGVNTNFSVALRVFKEYVR